MLTTLLCIGLICKYDVFKSYKYAFFFVLVLILFSTFFLSIWRVCPHRFYLIAHTSTYSFISMERAFGKRFVLFSFLRIQTDSQKGVFIFCWIKTAIYTRCNCHLKVGQVDFIIKCTSLIIFWLLNIDHIVAELFLFDGFLARLTVRVSF